MNIKNNDIDNPKVSICIPTYNGAKYINDTLNSALNQTYNNIEIIIIDDNSTDNTLAICEAYGKENPQIKIFKNSENLGLVKNWIKSIDNATSNWIKFLFQDDTIESNCVEKMMLAALKNNVNFVLCNRSYFFEKEVNNSIIRNYNNINKTGLILPHNTIINPEKTSKLISKNFFNNCLGEPPCYLFNKSIITPSFFPKKYKQIIDYVFALNIILQNDFIFLNENLVNFRVHLSSESMTTNLNKNAFEKLIYVKYFERLLLCHDLLFNPVFKRVKNRIPAKDVELIKNWTIIKSFKRLGYKRVKQFYLNQDIKDFIFTTQNKSYNFIKYRILKRRTKLIRKYYKV